MSELQRKAAAVKRRISRPLVRRRIPYVVTLTDFDKSGVRFEVGNLVEYFRVVGHGDETEYTTAMLGELRKDDVLFDIGANIGMVALHAASICTTIAFEPDPAIRARLLHNAGLNPDRKFTVETCAVSDSDTTVTLYTDGDCGNSPSLVNQRGETGTATVTARSLDSLIAENRLPAPTVIKLDIEGAEILALKGAERLLAGPNRPRALFIEVHDTFLPGFGSSPEEVHDLLKRYGYTNETYKVKRRGQTHLILRHSG